MNMGRRGFLAGSGLALLSLAVPRGARAACLGVGGLAGLGSFLTDPCFALVVRRKPVGGVGPNGEARRNIGTPDRLILEDQAAGLVWLRYGTIHGKADAVATGWSELDWGIAQQRRDGGFDSVDPVHQVTWFLESLASAIAIDPSKATATRKAALAAGLDWLEQPAQRRRADENGKTFTHRWWMRATLFQAASEILDRAALARRSEEFVQKAISQQTPSPGGGAFPERGGGDVGYQVLSLLYLERWLAQRPRGPLSAQAEKAMEAGLAWYLDRIGPDGIVDRKGSTRMLVENKDVLYDRAVDALLGASLLTADAKWSKIAGRLQQGAVTEGQAPPEALDKFELQPDGTPSRKMLDLCSLCKVD